MRVKGEGEGEGWGDLDAIEDGQLLSEAELPTLEHHHRHEAHLVRGRVRVRVSANPRAPSST